MRIEAERLLERSRDADPLFQATSFWAAARDAILADLDRHGIGNFRNEGASLSYFVPTYGAPGNALGPEQMDALAEIASKSLPKQRALIESWFSGAAHALSDYRAFAAAVRDTPAARLFGFSDCRVGNPRELFTFDGRDYSRSALNYLMGLALLSKHADLDTCRTFLEIGGGFGTLGHVLTSCWPDTHRYIDVDIPPTCLFADYYLEHACRAVPLLSSVDAAETGRLSVDELPRLACLPNWKIADLDGTVDVFVNFISFQEMEPDVVSNYLAHVTRLSPKWILLRNMREGKQRRSETNPAGVVDPITIDFYSTELTGYELVDTDTTLFGHRTSDGFHSDVLILRRT
ncbi:putative sugar O-methyltransferase [Rhodobacterales bacterium HKCCE2091]|nr:putative sugar O-methyltransferase [Rhodobacterales bacterium HKCCE2091]